MDKWNNVFNTLNLKMGKKALVGFLMMIFMGISGVAFASSASAINYTIEYKENVATNMPESVLGGLSPTASALLSNNSPLRAGFQFLGWCDQATTKSGNSDTCATGHSHQPGDTISLNQTVANNIKLYAIWQEVCAGYTTMQSLTSSSIATLLPNEHSTATVCDVRDEQTYTIAKLKDGKYWMVENLNLAGGTDLSADDTDVTSAYISSFSTSNNLTKTGDTIVLPASSTSGFSTNNYSYVYNSGNKTNCGASGQDTPCYSYYSWDVATLGSGRSISTDNTDAPYSICPKGWRLPTSRTTSATDWQTSSDFYQLAHQYGLDSTTSTSENDNGFYTQAGPGTIPNFLLAGHYYYGSFYDGGSTGRYWSSTSDSSTSYARSLYFSSSFVYSASNFSRYDGFSVRCVFDDTPYMQELTSSSIAELLPNVGDTATVKDKRDNQKYTIGKLADSKYWMTENLNLAGGTALSVDDTDVTSAYISSFSTSNNLTKTGNTIVLPASSTSGFDTNNYSYVYNSGNKTNCGASEQNTPCYSYYSWDAATLGSGRGIAAENTDAPYSVCPKGWRLPKSGADSNEGWKRGDFYVLAAAYGANLETNHDENSATFYNNAGPGTTPNFLLAGYYSTGSFGDGGSYGDYWSSTLYSSASSARYLSFVSSRVNSANGSGRRYGFSVRCVFGS